MTRLIGLGGYAFSGKDAVADHLITRGWAKTYMSHPLERALLALNPWVNVEDISWEGRLIPGPAPARAFSWAQYRDLHYWVGYNESKRNLDVRCYLQRLGTEVGRNILGEDVWVNAAFKEVDRLIAGSPVAITGIRFPNEMAAIKDRGGLAVWVSRPGNGPVNGHASDNTLSEVDFDLTIKNDGSLDDLYDQIDRRLL